MKILSFKQGIDKLIIFEEVAAAMENIRKLTAKLCNEKRVISNYVLELRHKVASYDEENYKIFINPHLLALKGCKIRMEQLMEETDCKECRFFLAKFPIYHSLGYVEQFTLMNCLTKHTANSHPMRLPYPLSYELAKIAYHSEIMHMRHIMSNLLLNEVSLYHNDVIKFKKICNFRLISGLLNFENFTSGFRAYHQRTKN